MLNCCNGRLRDYLMNRELKFRFWSLKDKCFVKSPRMWCRIDGTIDVEYNHGDVISQQFTGLKDKKGAEIYEGDIVQDNQGQYYRIVFEVKLAKFDLSIEGLVNTLSKWSYHTQVWESNILVVKGNIFENP